LTDGKGLHIMTGMQSGVGNGTPVQSGARRSRAWFWALLIVLVGPVVAALTLGIIGIFLAAASLTPAHRAAAGEDEAPRMRETWSCGHGDIKVVRIPVSGVLVEGDDGGLFASRGPVEEALRQIHAATHDHDTMAIILEINSPGGGMTASDLIYKALVDFKRELPGRKVVALLGDIAASGGYYVAAAADYIMAQPTTLTGSFSVIISKINVKGLGDQYGVKLDTIKSGRNKDMLSPFAEMSDEQRKILQDVVDELHGRFVSLIAEARPELSEEDVRQLADGRVFTGGKAREYKLVDEIGYWDDAVSRTCKLLDVDDIKVFRYGEEFSLSALLSGVQPVRLTVAGLVDRLARTRVLTMWQL